MNSRNRHVIYCVATGVIVVVLFAVVCFWARWACSASLAGLARDRAARISPLGPALEQIEREPNVVTASEASARIVHITPPIRALGLLDYITRIYPSTGYSDVYHWQWEPDGQWVYFDRKSGQIVYSFVRSGRPSATQVRQTRMQLYAGPEGVAERPDKTLGRFASPVVTPWHIDPHILYDPKLRRFFAVDFDKRHVRKGPELDKADTRRPVQVGPLGKHSEVCFQVDVVGPQRAVDDEPRHVPRPVPRYGNKYLVPAVFLATSLRPTPYTFVLDASGRIDRLNKETLEFAGPAAFISAPANLFGATERSALDGLFAYQVVPIVLRHRAPQDAWQYQGCLAGTLNREGSAISLQTFDERGMQMQAEQTKTVEYWWLPGSQGVTMLKFFLENLHPPVLSLLSYFSAPYSNAGSGFRALFILPDSFVAMKGRDFGPMHAVRFLAALVLVLPSILLGLCLAWHVSRDARGIGLSGDARRLWVVGTITFGLPAYITYRLTRPKTGLVTCQNCGKLRRPDMDRCHHCKSRWHVPELTPPAWRVLNEPESTAESFTPETGKDDEAVGKRTDPSD